MFVERLLNHGERWQVAEVGVGNNQDVAFPKVGQFRAHLARDTEAKPDGGGGNFECVFEWHRASAPGEGGMFIRPGLRTEFFGQALRATRSWPPLLPLKRARCSSGTPASRARGSKSGCSRCASANPAFRAISSSSGSS